MRSLQSADLAHIEVAAFAKSLLAELEALAFGSEIGGKGLAGIHASDARPIRPKALGPKPQRAAILALMWAKTSRFRIVGVLVMLFLAVGVAGCGSSRSASRTPEQERARVEGLQKAKEIEAKQEGFERTNAEEAEHTPEENRRHHEGEERNKMAEEEQEKASGEERALEKKAEESSGGQATKRYEYENAIPSEE